ncbi:hypothetical protein BC628DRAFT_1420564 [Trametes gibbosa]|nr:hypothetical protein BC628DRAFT_1420564 [Trametes gibbosa]
MKKLAARDFEDLLQCAIPTFEGLLPAPHDHLLRKMLFNLAMHHAMAKMRLHSDSTLTVFRNVTTSMGHAMRVFVTKVCPEYKTRELDKELAARHRRKSKKGAKGKSTCPADPAPPRENKDDAREDKHLNLNTYKFHRAGDYAKEIPETGTLLKIAL